MLCLDLPKLLRVGLCSQLLWTSCLASCTSPLVTSAWGKQAMCAGWATHRKIHVFYRGLWVPAAEVNLSYGLYLGRAWTQSKNTSVFLKKLMSRHLVSWSFLISAQKSHMIHSYVMFWYLPHFDFFKPKMSRVVLFWDVVDKSNYHLMHGYPISEQMINTVRLELWKHCV